jgi:hypothetical protein
MATFSTILPRNNLTKSDVEDFIRRLSRYGAGLGITEAFKNGLRDCVGQPVENLRFLALEWLYSRPDHGHL